MFGFFGFILLFILLIVLIGFALLGNLIRFIFGFGRRTPKRYYNQAESGNRADNTHSSTTSADNGNKKKIFGDDEGEYVEFEEVL